MAKDRPSWLADLSSAFKRHRQGRPGWFIEVNRDRLRVVSDEFPPRPDDPPGNGKRRRAVTLTTPPGPATFKQALNEACDLYDAVIDGQWRWPVADAPTADDPGRLDPSTLQKIVVRLRKAIVGEKIGASTWERTYRLYFERLVQVAGQRHWSNDAELLEEVVRHWPPNSRSRQMAHDRLRRLWKEVDWQWPESLVALRGNGKAAANPEGVRAFTDAEITELRARIQRSYRLTPADLVAWDCLIVFGLRPAELAGLELLEEEGMPLARVKRVKKSSKGSSGARTVPAVPPHGWPIHCHHLVQRWKEHGLPEGMVAARSPAETLGQQFTRLRKQKPVECELEAELTPYGCRHAFAIRLGLEVGLHPREAAELMGHSPAVHLSTYGRRLEQPKLLARVRSRVQQEAASQIEKRGAQCRLVPDLSGELPKRSTHTSSTSGRLNAMFNNVDNFLRISEPPQGFSVKTQ